MCRCKHRTSFPPEFRWLDIAATARLEPSSRYVAPRGVYRAATVQYTPQQPNADTHLATITLSTAQPRSARRVCVSAAASRDKPLKAIVEDEDSRFLVSVGAVFAVTLATCGLLLVNALDTRVETPSTKSAADVGIAPIISSKPALPEKETTTKAAATFQAASAPKAAPPAPKAPSAPSATSSEGGVPSTAVLAGVAVVAALGGAAAFTQQQDGGVVAPGMSSSVATSKAEAQAWIAAWRARTGVDASVRKRQAQAWIAAWRERAQ